jgi:hypothetical protein
MGVWTRDNPWRQSSILCAETAAELGLVPPGGAGDLLPVVISHDCDLAQPIDSEPRVEIINGLAIPRLDGNFTFAKNPRRLHLAMQQEGNPAAMELTATSKSSIAKEGLIGRAPDGRFQFLPRDLAVLQNWLAARYRRAALPDAFEDMLRRANLHEAIAKILKPLGADIIAMFFELDDGQKIERLPAEPYRIALYLLYATDDDPERARSAAAQARTAISVAFKNAGAKLATAGIGTIELTLCEAYPDSVMPYAVAHQLSKWNLDHVSLRAEPQTALLV